jgi:broad specificity phosphatase PhoE
MIYFVRHGESEANARKVFAGKRDDSLLTKKGEEQAKEVANHVKSLGISIDSLLRKYKLSDINPHIKTAAELEKMYYSCPGYDKKIKKYGLIVISIK